MLDFTEVEVGEQRVIKERRKLHEAAIKEYDRHKTLQGINF